MARGDKIRTTRLVHNGTTLLVLHHVDEFPEFVHGDVLLLHERRHGVEIGVAEELAYDVFKRSAAVLVAAHRGEILETACRQGAVRQKTLLLEYAYERRQSVHVRLWLVITSLKLSYLHVAVAPVVVHYLFFLVCECLHNGFCFLQWQSN